MANIKLISMEVTGIYEPKKVNIGIEFLYFKYDSESALQYSTGALVDCKIIRNYFSRISRSRYRMLSKLNSNYKLN